MTNDDIIIRARNWETLCLYGWHPYMYNPHLHRWLRRIGVPTLMLWGASDGIVTPAYGRAYSELIPDSRFELIAEAEKGIKLFATEVLPRLKAIAPVSVR